MVPKERRKADMAFWENDSAPAGAPTISDMYRSPGHLIRRCQQISVSLFADELGEFDLTPIQYAALLAIRDEPDIDQRSLSRIIAIDRSTVGTVLKTLEKKGLIVREIPDDNQRIKTARVTDASIELLDGTFAAVSRVQRRLLEPLSPEEQTIFLELLSKLVDLNNTASRAPLDLSKRKELGGGQPST